MSRSATTPRPLPPMGAIRSGTRSVLRTTTWARDVSCMSASGLNRGVAWLWIAGFDNTARDSLNGAGTRMRERSTRRVVLVEPRLAQRVRAPAQEAAQFDRFGARGGEVELSPPVARNLVRHRLGAHVRERPARGPEYRLRDGVEGQAGERLP